MFSLLKKTVVAFKQYKDLNLRQFFGKTVRENFRANSQVLFSSETRLWESSMFNQPAFWILEIFFDRFLETF